MKYVEILGERLPIKDSPSFLTKSLCPRLLKKNYIDKEEVKTIRVAAERGKAAHRVSEMLIRHALDEGIEVADIPNELVVEAVEESTPYTIMSEIGDILTWMKLWRDRFKLRDRATIVGMEQRLALDDSYDECDWSDASYRGVLDLLRIDDDHAEVTDWKSQPNILNQGDLAVHEQTTFYCWLAWKLYPYLTRFTVNIWYLRYGFQAAARRTVEDLEEFEDFLIMRERKLVEIDSWDPIPGKHCGYCDYIHDCPLATELGPQNPNIISQEQAVLAAQRVTVMETILKELKGGLKDYVKKNDEILTANDWVYGYKKSVGSRWDPAEVQKVLEDHGHDLSDIASIDSRKIQKLIKTARYEGELGLVAELEAIAHEKISTSFSGYQKGSQRG